MFVKKLSVGLAAILAFVAVAVYKGESRLARAIEYEMECSYTLIEWMDGPCRCYGANGVVYDSCEMAVIDPNDPESMAISACYYVDPTYECYTDNVPCGMVVRLDRPCNEPGPRSVVATFPTKPPCLGTAGSCTDNHGGHFP